MRTVLLPDDTLLGLLALKARHGYELIECFRQPEQLGRVWTLSTSQLYAVLKRLEHSNLIVGHDMINDQAPTRIVYTLTDAGQTRLHIWLHDPAPSPSIRSTRVEFLSRLFIARHLNIPTQTLIAYQRQACVQALAVFIDQRGNAVPGMDVLALDFQIAQMHAVIDWIDRAELIRRDK